MKRIFEISLIALMFTLGASLAHATPISSCQALLTAGTYELTQDITCPTTGLSFASNVTFDGQGHSITYTGNSNLASALNISGTGYPNRLDAENITVRNVRIADFPYALWMRLGTGVSSTLRNITLENIESSGSWGSYERGSIELSAYSSQEFLNLYSPRRLENVTFRNISFLSPYGSFSTGYLVNSLIDGVSFYGGGSAGSYNISRFHWKGFNSTIQNVQFVSDQPANIPSQPPLTQYLMTSECDAGLTSYPSPGVGPFYDPICGAMVLRNISFVGPQPRYDFRLGGVYRRTSYGNYLDNPGYASATLEDSQVRTYLIQRSAQNAGQTIPTSMVFQRSAFGSISVSRTLLDLVTGDNLFTSTPESEFLIENNRLRFPEVGPLAGPARLTFQNLPLCWDAVQIHRNGQLCDSAVCTQVERFGTRAIFDVTIGGDYSLFVQSTHPECSKGGGMCTDPWDYNRDGAVNVSDLFAFLTAWFAHTGPN